jgi:hypothetical protein
VRSRKCRAPISPAAQWAAFGSESGTLSQWSLHGCIKRAEKPRPVPLGQGSWSAGIRSELLGAPRDLATDERVTYIRLRPVFAGRGDNARQRDASGISEVTHTSTAEMYSAIQSSAASALSPTRTMLTLGAPGGRIGREPFETTKTSSRRRAATR